ncbi:GNAT family N-acetyltransferase [Iamia sp. SCSIO 61187]|uniref:GNAT family N-acetyltransferase n=1 Tax=Iamia sp. SCSIO 61187 TaxID=2722752 RepID=UPI001C630D30|nr:GNAT family N-acetyltransferase [Iamia sp. SCSIO 61187]QYG91904.1 GNAT family N-acetyltransferase [Iamia sp. SCSIO 61187]
MTTIRRAAPGDAEPIARVWYEAWSDGHTGHVPDGLLAHRRPEHFARRAVDRVEQSWVAEIDGEVVGFVTVEGDELEQIFVLRRARGTGVATDLLRVGEDAIHAAGHEVAWLAVVAGNARARAFYERQGWVDAGEVAYEAGTDDGTFIVPCRRYESRQPGAPRR